MDPKWKEQLEQHRNKRREDIIQGAQQLFLRSKAANEVREQDVFQLANELLGGRAPMLIGFLRMFAM